ncbi:hypothetical protein [Allorhodopirellula heiligendammensis]|uniref:Uncharacterized protein n=1 Tax=Allorhodopirellula heiligendammensis TaxID=2714739 RepID=A0A5C6C118_9BACT|nr:hypothetical protein [Allorhodopirellula heiligendammensis]TWU18273.1 hypothetical protein Poly21_04340 [Allorhodopirellula heiligendammensis]
MIQLLAEFDHLIDLHETASWQETKERVFTKIATTNLRRARSDLAAPIKAATTDRVWAVISKFAVELICCTTEGLDFKKEIFSEKVRLDLERMGEKPCRKTAHLQIYHEMGDDKEVIEVLFLLRNHGAHGEDPKRKQDWTRIERFVAAILGKRYGKNSRHKKPLQLTEYEGSEVKLKILQQLCDAIGKLNTSR